LAPKTPTKKTRSTSASSPNPPTYAAGAAKERDLVRRYLRRQRLAASQAGLGIDVAVYETVIAWLNRQPQRTLRKGGTGRA
jgi:hypothetical protein